MVAVAADRIHAVVHTNQEDLTRVTGHTNKLIQQQVANIEFVQVDLHVVLIKIVTWVLKVMQVTFMM
jgi:hypothetical protein